MRWAAVAVVILGVFASAAFAQNKPSIKTDKEKISYVLGFDAGARFPKDSVDLDSKAYAAGFADGLARAKPVMGEAELQKVLADFQQQMRTKLAAAVQQAATENKKKGDAYLAENKKQRGVVALPSGLQYKVLKEGKGAKPKATDTVSVNYRGTLTDGTEFDNSAKHGGPVEFPVNQVIPGWTEAMQLMPVGAKWQLVIPPDLAYGMKGAGQQIGPNSTLVFEVELLDIKK
jgi:FKBP-type peptidyl-prolyl cis-trans isomerase FklB